MKTELPTKTGPYYWREKDGDEWELWHVLDNGSELTAHRGFNVAFLPDLGGQWLPIPTAEELVELQAKAKAYDEGEYLLSCIGADLNISLVNISESNYMQQKGYTCRKVRVCKEVEHV